jgi:hypothetical protein
MFEPLLKLRRRVPELLRAVRGAQLRRIPPGRQLAPVAGRRAYYRLVLRAVQLRHPCQRGRADRGPGAAGTPAAPSRAVGVRVHDRGVSNVLDPEPGSSFAVFGTGAVGFAGLLAAKVAGATTIVAVGVVPPPNSTGVQSGCHLLTPTQ